MSYKKPTITLTDALHAIQSDTTKGDTVIDNSSQQNHFDTNSAYDADE